MGFEFATATRIIFGAGSFDMLGSLVSELGKRALVVTGVPAELTQPVLDKLAGKGVSAVTFTVLDEPTTHLVAEGIQLARQASCEVVIGFGGGSAIDTGKPLQPCSPMMVSCWITWRSSA